MSIRRITFSVQPEVAKRIKKAAGVKPVSAWLTEVIEEHLDDAELERRWQEFYAAVAPLPSDRKRARTIFDDLTKNRRRRGAA
jgi:hypothetical protein